MSEEERQLVLKNIEAEVDRSGLPQTQEEYCAILARAVIASFGVTPEFAIITSAAAAARGLFGDAFERADYGQRVIWIDMCESAIREAIRNVETPNAE